MMITLVSTPKQHLPKHMQHSVGEFATFLNREFTVYKKFFFYYYDGLQPKMRAGII